MGGITSVVAFVVALLGLGWLEEGMGPRMPGPPSSLKTRWLRRRRASARLPISDQGIDRVHSRRPPRGVVFDMDSSVSPTHGEQEISVWNGSLCLHLLSSAGAQNQGSRWRARASAASLTSSFRAPDGVAIDVAKTIRRACPSRIMSQPSGSMPAMRQDPGEAPARDVA